MALTSNASRYRGGSASDGLRDELTKRVEDPFWRSYIQSAFGVASPASGAHLAVFSEPFLTLLLARTKTIESRFSLNRCAPYNKVLRGDLILLKRQAGPVVGLAVAGEPAYFELDQEAWSVVHEKFASRICAPVEFWEKKRNARYATIIPIRDVLPIEPLRIAKSDRRGWVAFNRPQGSHDGYSTPYAVAG
jgi:hypothetical protein